MRVIAGSLGGRRFSPPANIPARPTTDLAREGLFNILQNLIDLKDLTALDLFAGTGAVSYELASRGSGPVTAVEKDAASVAFIRKTASSFHIEDRLSIVQADVFRFLQKANHSFPLIFADPPYALPGMNDLCRQMIECLSPDGMAVIEHDGRNGFENHPHFLRAKTYGDTIFTIFTAAPKTS